MRAVALTALVLAVLPAHAQLAGPYTVGGAAPDYATLTDAVADLNAVGISAPVTFKIRGGTYDEQVTIETFARSGAPDDPVTFEPATRGVPPVTWRASAATSTDNWVVRVVGADHVVFDGITFEAAAAAPVGRLVVLDVGGGVSEGVVVRDATLTGHVGPGSDAGSLVWAHPDVPPAALTVERSTLSYGWRGVDVVGGGGNADVAVTDNTFLGQEAGAIRAHGGGRVERNDVADGYASAPDYEGIWIEANLDATIARNEVDVFAGDTGIVAAGVTGTVRVENNAVSVRSASGTVGIHASNAEVVHNTVRTTGAARALMVSWPVGGVTGPIEATVENNVLVADGAGAALYIRDATDDVASDRNDLYTSSGSLAEVGLTAYSTLADWRAATGLDDASVSVAVTFVQTAGAPGDADLRLAGGSVETPALIGYETARTGVTVDLDGDARHVYTPYVGADEGAPLPPLDNADAANGTFYTVAGASPDFATPQDFFDHLSARGMGGPVTARFRDGTFPVHARLFDRRFGGAKTDPLGTPLVLRTANQGYSPAFTHAASGDGDNWVLRVDGLGQVQLLGLTLDASAGGDYSQALVVGTNARGDGAPNLTLTECTFVGAPAPADPDRAALVAVPGGSHSYATVTESAFVGGSWGIAMADGASWFGATVTGSTFADGAEGGLSGALSSGVVTGNTVTTDGTWGLRLRRGAGLTVTANQVSVPNGYGLYLDGPYATEVPGFEAPVLVANNGVRAEAPVWVGGGATGVEVLFNTLSATGAPAVEVEAGAQVADLTGNVAVAAAGPALRLGAVADVGAADTNVLWSEAGSDVVEVGGTAYDLGGWQAASGLDGRSLAFAPTFVDAAAGDLRLDPVHAGDPRFAAAPRPAVPTDLQGDPRHASNPYAGADELATPLDPLSGDYAVGEHPSYVPPDYSTLDDALLAVGRLGVSGPTAFGLRPGSYPRIVLGEIPGASATNRVTLYSTALFEAVVDHAPASVADNGAVVLEGTDHLSLSGIVLDVSAGAGGQGLVLRDGNEGVTVTNVDIRGQSSPINAVAYAGVYAPGPTTGLTLTNVIVTDATYGLFLNPGYEDPTFDGVSTGTRLDGVRLLDFTADGALILDQEDLVIDGAQVVATSGNDGVRISDALGVSITASTIAVGSGAASGGSDALVLTDVDGEPEAPVVVANSVLAGSTGARLSGVDHLRFVHNTAVAEFGTGAAFSTGLGSDQHLTNNLLVATDGGLALDLGAAGTVAAEDHNDLHTTGSVLVSVAGSGDYADLAAYQAGTGFGANSVSVAAPFVDPAARDFHLTGTAYGALTGTPLADVPTDVDGEPRSETAPHLGADEVAGLGVAFTLLMRLQGATGADGKQSTALAAGGHLPTDQPYADPAFDGTALDYDGDPRFAAAESLPADFFASRSYFSDWVLVALRETPTGPDVTRRAVLLHTDGIAFATDPSGALLPVTFPDAAPGSYHVVAYHRNHVPLMTTAADLDGTTGSVSLANPTGAGLYGGSGAYTLVPSGVGGEAAALWAADGSGDGLVTAPDFNVYGSASGAGAAGYVAGDYTLDGQVTAPDFNLYSANAAAGAASGVPD